MQLPFTYKDWRDVRMIPHCAILSQSEAIQDLEQI